MFSWEPGDITGNGNVEEMGMLLIMPDKKQWN